MNDLYTRVAGLVPRLSRRLPAPLRCQRLEHRLGDWLSFKSASTPSRTRELEAARRSCGSDEGWFAFASEVFPSHQQRGEILEFIRFAREREPKVAMEIGTAQGGTNFLLSQLLGQLENMIGVDLHVSNRRLLGRYGREGVTLSFVEGSSRADETLDRVREILAGRSIDVLFIDGDHSYFGVREDFRIYRDLVREGGLIAFHDIVPDSETRCGIKTGNWAGEVPKFWATLKPHYETREFVASPDQDGFGIGVMVHRQGGAVPD